MSEIDTSATTIAAPPPTPASATPDDKQQPRTLKLKQPRFNEQQVKILTVIAFVAAIVLQIMFWPIDGFLAFFRFVFVVCIAAYLPSYYDGSESSPIGRPWTFWVRDMGWKDTLFPTSPALKFDGEVPDKSKQYIVALSPHGSLSLNHWYLNTCDFSRHFGTKRRSLGGDVIFNIPLYRDMMLGGSIVSASRENTKALLSNGYTVIVLPGGIEEQVATVYRKQAIYTKSKGIFKYALEFDVPVVPIYSMCEVGLVKTWNPFQKLRNFLAVKYKFPIYFCSFKLESRDVPCIAGTPLTLKIAKPGEPTPEEVDTLHNMYVQEVKRIYYKYRAEYGYGDVDLEIT